MSNPTDDRPWVLPTDAQVEAAAKMLFEVRGNSFNWTWPQHDDDDGYRGDRGYVTIAPDDVIERYRSHARSVATAVLNTHS